MPPIGTNDPIYDCLIVGAGPGGLQAAIHLARYNRRVLLVDRGGGRTSHAPHIVNYLGLKEISGRELIANGLAQVKKFGVEVVKDSVVRIEKNSTFVVHVSGRSFLSRFVVVSAGAVDNQPKLKNLGKFFGKGYYTCVDCDGHLTTGSKLLVMGNSVNAARLALGMKAMYTDDVTLLLTDFAPPADYREAVEDENIHVHYGTPVALVGESKLEAVQLGDGKTLDCTAIMASYGWKLHDSFLEGLSLERDHERFKILASSTCESSLSGLYVVGAMKPGHSQAIIAAGQGAVAAIDINHRLLGI